MVDDDTMGSTHVSTSVIAGGSLQIHVSVGLDLDCVQNALVEENFFDVDDDALCVKSGRDFDGRAYGRPSRDILFRNNVIGRGHGITVGSETSGSVFNVTFDNITMAQTGTGIRMKTQRGRGGVVSGITYRNIDMHEIQGQCVQITLNYHAGLLKTNKTGTPVFKDILLENVRCDKGATSYWIDGLVRALHRSIISLLPQQCQYLRNQIECVIAGAKH